MNLEVLEAHGLLTYETDVHEEGECKVCWKRTESGSLFTIDENF